jgi:plastocyanin
MPRLFRLFPLTRVAAALVFAACAGDDNVIAPVDDVVDVYTPGAVFTPFTAEISAGGTVRFHMARASDGDGHNAIFSKAVPGAPEDVNIVADTVVSRVFATRGTFGYICTVHPGMAGEVVVH